MDMGVVVLARVVTTTMRIHRSPRTHPRRQIHLQWVRQTLLLLLGQLIFSSAKAFTQAQLDLADAPLLTAPPSAISDGEGRNGSADPASRFDSESAHLHRLDTPVRVVRSENNSKVDASVVDALLQETATAAGVTRALAERVEALERALEVRVGGESQYGKAEGGGGSGVAGNINDVKMNGHTDVEDGLRLQLRIAEAERDRAQRIVQEMTTFLLDGERATLQRGG
ncbi:hypothetical protein JVU11DRAFT_11686 [Chiua virens]|nr:hypothetical protein JVU11DRAFT_11686 [Chiua virens]